MAVTKSTYNQLDLLNGLFERDIREEKFVKLLLAEVTNLKYVWAQCGCSTLPDATRQILKDDVDYTLFLMVSLCKDLMKANKKYTTTDWDSYLLHPKVYSNECPDKETISGYFQNSESRLRGYLFAFKEVLPPRFDNKKFLSYLRHANNLLS